MNQQSLTPVSPLQHALDSYAQLFGHRVPSGVVTMYANQPGPLLIEIRQAIALQRPVPAWRDHARRAEAGAGVQPHL